MLLQNLNRFHAFGGHLVASLGMALLSAGLVFLLWYPGALAYASDVSAIFLLLLSVDVVLGPVLTLIIFNPRKKELKRDLMIVAIIQLSALLYGLHTVFVVRPVYLAFNSNRIDLVYANEISAENLAKDSRPEYKSLPVFGPGLIAAPLPHDARVRGEIMLSVLSGGDDVQQMPQYYVPYMDQKAEVLKQLQPLDHLKASNPNKQQEIDALLHKYNATAGYLPLKAKVNDLAVILSRTTGEVLEITTLKPRI